MFKDSFEWLKEKEEAELRIEVICYMGEERRTKKCKVPIYGVIKA